MRCACSASLRSCDRVEPESLSSEYSSCSPAVGGNSSPPPCLWQRVEMTRDIDTSAVFILTARRWYRSRYLLTPGVAHALAFTLSVNQVSSLVFIDHRETALSVFVVRARASASAMKNQMHCRDPLITFPMKKYWCDLASPASDLCCIIQRIRHTCIFSSKSCRHILYMADSFAGVPHSRRSLCKFTVQYI